MMNQESTQETNVEEVVETTEHDTEQQESNETKTFTQEQLNDILKGRLEKQAKSYEKKMTEVANNAIEEYKASQKEEKRLAGLSEKERLNEELLKAQEEIEQLKAVQQRANMLKETRSQLSEKDINVSDEILEMITTDNAESTLQNINAVETWLTELHKSWEVERAKGHTPKSMSVSNEAPVITSEQFDMMSSTERAELFKENPNLFNQLTKRGN